MAKHMRIRAIGNCREGGDSMQVEIRDDFDLNKIAQSGQCFRAKHMGAGVFRFVTGEHLLYIHRLSGTRYAVSCGKEEWDTVWHDYFDLGTDYRAIREDEQDKHPFIRKAVEYGRGLRILRQDSWEMLVTFIISQRKNIPAIAKAVELLADRYGHPLASNREAVCSFPTAEDMRKAGVDDLRDCGLGYRAPYVHDAVAKVLRRDIDLDAIAGHKDGQLFHELQQINGVGKKVANCVCLFGYGRKSCVPVDVWISRAMQKCLKGASLEDLFGSRAGIIQQYLFFYERSHWHQ